MCRVDYGEGNSSPLLKVMNKYNHIIDYKDVTADSTVTEPVTVQECKDWLRLEGFTDDSDSTSPDFDDDDTFIDMLITSARERLEEYTGLSLVPKTWEVELTNLAGYIELPFGPVVDITSVEDTDGNSLDYTTTNNLSKLKTPIQANIIVTYDAGYSTAPNWLKHGLLTEVAYRYTHRGDEELRGLCQDALNIVSPYKSVNSWLQ